MAKALTLVMLLVATAALAAAHPAFGKGGSVQVNATADTSASKQITITKDQGPDLSKCDCKDDCKVETRKRCKEVPKTEEKCADVEVEEPAVVCTPKCFKADKVITVGKGRRLLSANNMNTIPHMIAKAAIVKSVSASVKKTEEPAPEQRQPQQEICREICKNTTKKSTKKDCKKETKVELVDCKDEVVSSRCVKNCVCGEKTITITKTPDFGAIFKSIGKGK